MSTPESQKLRDRIRSGEIPPYTLEYAWAVGRVYELERAAEAAADSLACGVAYSATSVA